MGAGASVLQGEEAADGGVDLDTFALVQSEYHRLSCRDLDVDAEAPPPSDEEVFAMLKGVVAQRYQLKKPPADEVNGVEESPRGEGEHESEEPTEQEVALLVNPVAIQRRRTSEALTVLATSPPNAIEAIPEAAEAGPDMDMIADAIPVAEVEGEDGDGGSTRQLVNQSFGRSFASLSGSSRSAFDLTQNLTPVFTTDVLTDPTTLKMITSYADRQQIAHGVDWVRFWVEIDELAQLPSHSYTNRRLRKIYDKFLSPEAPSPVCVTSAMLGDIEAALQSDNISAGIYADAQQVCLTALEQSVYPRFRENRLFKKMIDFCTPPPMSQKQLQQAQAAGVALETEDYTLSAILSHPAKLRFLKTYCMEALALENLLFFLEVEDCKRLPNLSFIANKTRKIYDRYCAKSSRNYLGLPDAVLAELHAAAEQKQPLIPKLFYEAQLLVFQRISDEVWRGFCRTSEYLEYSRRLKPDQKRRLPTARNATRLSAEQSEQMQRKLEGMHEFQLIDTAMHYPVSKLIPMRGRERDAGDVVVSSEMNAQQTQVFTPDEQLTILLSDSFGKKFFKQFMHKRGIDQFLAFCEEVEDFKLLPGIEFLQHTAKKIYRKYILPSAKLQVDMSRAMRDEIGERLLNPSIDMFKRISQRVRHGMLQDSMPRFVKSTFYNDLKKLAKQYKEVAIEADLKAIDAAAKKGKLELAHLDMLLLNQLCMKQFRLFLESQHCSENLMLWEEIEHFRRLPSYQIVLRSAKKIYDKYLNPSNSRNATIPLSEALHGRVLAQLDAASRTTFDEVENECYELMRNVVVPDFLDSRIFMALVGTWAVVDEEYPAEMLKGEFEMAFLRHRFHLVQEARGLSRDTATPKGSLASG